MIIPDKKYFKGARSKEIHIKNKFPEFYDMLIDIYPEYLSFKEKLYWYYNNLNEHPICGYCGKRLIFIDGDVGYRSFCSVKCATNSDTTKNKRINTCLKVYGVSHPHQSDIIQDKMRHALIDKYGSMDNYNQIRLNKIKNTNIDKYGVEYPLQSSSVQQKSKQTCLEKYGAPTALLDESVQQKSKQTCLEKYGVEKFTNRNQSIITRNKNIISNKDLFDIIYEGGIKYYICKCYDTSCNKCDDKLFKIPASIYHTRTEQNTELCTIKKPVGSNFISTIEFKILALLDEYNIQYELHNRTILNGYELDIYIPSKRIAIECNGIYWHNSDNVAKDYHYNKFKKCKDNDIQLLSFWEDHIYNNFEKVKDILLSKLGIFEYKIYARSCTVKEITNKQLSDFCNKYHIQNHINAKIKIGLFYNNDLVSVMSFGKTRRALGNSNNYNQSMGIYELYRYCCKSGYLIIGGASKLFNYFIKTYRPDKIISFSSNDISNGSLYKMLNFQLKYDDNLSYWYVNNNFIRYHRFKFRKSELVKLGFDMNLSESEIVKLMKLNKIYDSGQSKWEWG